MMKAFLEKYTSIKYIIIFFIIYMIGFISLENWTSPYMIITDSWIDKYIPFNEYFVIPYLFWFVFIALGFAYFVFIDQVGLKRTCFYLFLGMSISLFIYFILPNGQNLRVDIQHENLFQDIIAFIYSIDSSTNVCPSIHVYNSLMMMISLLKSNKIKIHRILSIGIIGLAFLICLSTVMIKQHAFIDVIVAMILVIIIYVIGNRKYGY